MFIFRNNEWAKVMLCNGNIVFIKCKGYGRPGGDWGKLIARLFLGILVNPQEI